MADPIDEPCTGDDFDPVYVELDWYDGPRAGLAAARGVPHYFRAVHDYAHPDDADDEYFVWPASEIAVAWEREQWAIFVEWNARYEAGEATVDSHPGHGGVNSRYDELERLLATHRTAPEHACRLKAEWRWPTAPPQLRYHVYGLDYQVRWQSP